ADLHQRLARHRRSIPCEPMVGNAWAPMDSSRIYEYADAMKLEDVRPADCYARAQRLLGECVLVRAEMGRAEDARPIPTVSHAQLRECFCEAVATWRKAERLAAEVGVRTARFSQGVGNLRDARPGHVLQVIDAVLSTLDGVKQKLLIPERTNEPAVEDGKQ